MEPVLREDGAKGEEGTAAEEGELRTVSGRGEEAPAPQPASPRLAEPALVNRRSSGGDIHCSRDRNTACLNQEATKASSYQSAQKRGQFPQEGSNESRAPERSVRQRDRQSDQIVHLEGCNTGSFNPPKDRSNVLISVTALLRAATTELSVGRQGRDAAAILRKESGG